MTDASALPQEPSRFSAVLTPHRSLGPKGFMVLMGAVGAISFGTDLFFYLLGAWPVVGFMGLDVWLLWFLFKRSYLDARRSETLLLTDRELIVDRVAPDGEREQHRLDAYWLRVELLGKDSERLALVSRGNRVVIGRFLAPVERRKVAEQLKAAIADMRAPRYAHDWDQSPSTSFMP